MKQITLDYKLYQQELTEAATYGANLSTDIIKSIEDCLMHLNNYSSEEQYGDAKRRLHILLRDLKSYGKNK